MSRFQQIRSSERNFDRTVAVTWSTVPLMVRLPPIVQHSDATYARVEKKHSTGRWARTHASTSSVLLTYTLPQAVLVQASVEEVVGHPTHVKLPSARTPHRRSTSAPTRRSSIVRRGFLTGRPSVAAEAR